MSIKSILVYSTLLVLDLSIEYLLLVAHCLNFILHYLNDDPPVNHPSIASTVEETPGGKDDTNYENGANAVGIAPITTGDSPFDAFSQSEVQTHSPSPSATSRSMPTSQNRMATTPLNHQRVDSDVRTPLGPSVRVLH
ncbi:hypothetical protein FRB99_000153 [Tulasnella sp. 403]|nr:hypothetical protein FRB99_000153 [Tulasnella sp. 403]